MTDPVKFAIVGTGAYGLSRCEAVQQAPGAELVAVADVDEARAREAGTKLGVAWETDYRRLLDRDDIDVVGVFTQSALHRDIAANAAAAGKHVVMTKPIDVTLERAQGIVEACANAGVRLFCEFYLRYMRDNFRIYEAVAAGAFGKLILGDFSYKCYRPQSYYEADGGWRGTLRYAGGGIVMNQSIHAIDKLRWYLGDVASVQALTGSYTHTTEVEDTAAALLEMRSGAMGVLIGTATFHNDRPVHPFYGGGSTSRSEVNGESGSVMALNDAITMWRPDPNISWKETAPVTSIFEDVARALTEDGYDSPTLVSGEDAVAALEIVLAIYKSARTRRPVDVAGQHQTPVGA